MSLVLNSIGRSVFAFLLFLLLFGCSSVQEPNLQGFTKFKGLGFEIMLPPDFDYENHQPLKNAVVSYSFFGSKRADTFIRIDIYNAEFNRNLQKIVGQNIDFFPDASSTETIFLNDIKTLTFDYQASEIVSGKAYFLLYSNRMYRIILNWYKPQKDNYFPMFEKSINTISFNL